MLSAAISLSLHVILRPFRMEKGSMGVCLSSLESIGDIMRLDAWQLIENAMYLTSFE